MNFYFVSCPKGLEEVLKQESYQFDLDKRELSPGGLKIQGELPQILSFMMESRIASRFYKEIAQIHFSHEKRMLLAAKEIPWTKIMDVKDTFKIQCLLSREVKDDFKNSHYLSLVLKDAIVDNFQEKIKDRPSINLDNPHYSYLLRIDKGKKKKYQGTVLVDLSGRPLHQRGYRDTRHDAPIKENLAAGLVLLSDWNKKDSFYDLFCGSGTIIMEGAYIKHNIPSTYLRLISFLEGNDEFDLIFHSWFKKDPENDKLLDRLAKELVMRGDKAIEKMEPDEFFASDVSTKSINLTAMAWKNAGFPKETLAIRRDTATRVMPETDNGGVIISNPPYGLRLESNDDEALKALYYDFGENLKTNWKGHQAYIIVQDPELRKKISLRTEKRITVWNGGVECRLLKYDLF